MSEKTCSRCKLTKPLEEFSRDKTYPDGHKARCRACMVDIRAEVYRADPKRAQAQRRRRHERWRVRTGAQPRRVFASEAERAAAESQRAARAYRRYVARHPDRHKATQINSVAKRRGATGEVTAHEWKQILLFYGQACALCRTPASERPLTVDHYIPISKGGENTWRNVWPLCVPCNRKKHERVPAGEPPHVAALAPTGT